jgi:hypothetical protein
MELSAFAHMARRNVKVVQPGLVYVIEWQAFVVSHSPTSPTFPEAPATVSPSIGGTGHAAAASACGSSPRFPDKELRDDDPEGADSTIYVACVFFSYHSLPF